MENNTNTEKPEHRMDSCLQHLLMMVIWKFSKREKIVLTEKDVRDCIEDTKYGGGPALLVCNNKDSIELQVVTKKELVTF
jgi:hypothetical protein